MRDESYGISPKVFEVIKSWFNKKPKVKIKIYGTPSKYQKK